jgi:twinkle protein
MPPFVQNETKNQEITPILGSYVPLKKRGISDTTCKQFGYFKGTYGDSEAYYWPIYDKERRLTGYKIRKPNKQFVQHGTNPDNTFLGQEKWGSVGSCSLYSKGSTTVSLTLRSVNPGLASRCRTALIRRKSALGRILIGS